MTRGPSTNAVSTPTVARAGSRRSPRLTQKSRGDGSYSQLRRISSPLTAKKISTPTLPSVLPSWCSGSGWSSTANECDTRTAHAASSRSRSKLLCRLPTTSDRRTDENACLEVSAGAERGADMARRLSTEGPGSGIGERGAARPRITRHGLPRPDGRGARTPWPSLAGRSSCWVRPWSAAIAGYLVLVLTARHLDAAENADFLVFWAALFSVFGVLVGIATETTRAVFAAESDGHPVGRRPRGSGGSPTIGVGTAVVLGVSGLWWGSHLFGDRWTDLLPVLLVGCRAVRRALRARRRARGPFGVGPLRGAGGRRVHGARARRRVWSPSSAPPSSGSPWPAPSRPAPGCSSCWSRRGSGGRCLPGPTSAWARSWPASSAPARRPPPPPCCWWASRCC